MSKTQPLERHLLERLVAAMAPSEGEKSLRAFLQRNADSIDELIGDHAWFSQITELSGSPFHAIIRACADLGIEPEAMLEPWPAGQATIPAVVDWNAVAARRAERDDFTLARPRRYSFARSCLQCGRPVAPTFDLDAGDHEHGTYETCCF